MKKTSFILIIICALLNNINAQTPNRSRSGRNLTPNEQTMQTINAAEYIFEGEILEAKSYYNKDSSEIYTSVKVKVNAVYKGNLTEGEIVEQIEDGGTIGLDERVPRHGGPAVSYRESYILFCKKIAKVPVTNQAYNLPVKISYVNSRSYLVYGDDSDLEMFGLNYIGFKTKQDVENLLLKVPGVTLPPKKQVEVQVESKPQADTLSIEEFFNQNNLDGKKAKQIMENRKKKTLNQSKSGTLHPLGGTTGNTLTLTFNNDTIIKQSGNNYYEFDVMASANNANSYFSSTIISLKYNTAAFGTNISLNNAITLSLGSTFSVTEYKLSTQDADARNVIIVVGDSARKNWHRTLINSTPVRLLHVKIKINNCNTTSGFDLTDAPNWSSFSRYFSSAGANESTYIEYDNTNYLTNIGNSLCPSINNFSPSKIHSGNKQVLTITGTGFGTKQGNVIFKDANQVDRDLKGLDNEYIKTWTDTKIEVFVPSLVTENYDPRVTKPGAGSGTFKVVNANGTEAITTNALDIEYAMVNAGDGKKYHFNLLHLAKINCVNGWVFTLHTSFKGKLDAIATVQKAASDWANVLSITMDIEKDANNNPVFVSDINAANKNMLYFDVNLLPPNLAETGSKSNKVVVVKSSDTTFYRPDVHIAFSDPSNTPWHYIATGVLPTNKQDFYSTILHEMGHAIGLNHDIDLANGNGKLELMYWYEGPSTNEISANQRKNLTQYGARTVAGGKAKIAIDKAKTWATTAVATLSTFTISASGSTTFNYPDSVILTSSSATTYLWSNNATTQSITVKNTGSYSVSVTKDGCTSKSAAIYVKVKFLPTETFASDFNLDGTVNITDFLSLLATFNTNCTCREDTNNDGIVNITDFLLLTSQFGFTVK